MRLCAAAAAVGGGGLHVAWQAARGGGVHAAAGCTRRGGLVCAAARRCSPPAPLVTDGARRPRRNCLGALPAYGGLLACGAHRLRHCLPVPLTTNGAQHLGALTACGAQLPGSLPPVSFTTCGADCVRCAGACARCSWVGGVPLRHFRCMWRASVAVPVALAVWQRLCGGPVYKQPDKQANRQTDKQTSRHAGRQADRQAGRQAGRRRESR
mmetsp:Transcript_8618/g.26180  ORF Transcript_8618/g.26180 Transcript_8618/m.26180 type:complete len:211 (+) Transcript_8618:1551-2183(+)|eukprot:356917-Chlamydomonas_euryale.AAC.4